jgi:hypothetical protein
MSEKETYLGDGLYASFDGYQFDLRAPREHGDHWVGLEPQVLNSFIDFVNIQTVRRGLKLVWVAAVPLEKEPST